MQYLKFKHFLKLPLNCNIKNTEEDKEINKLWYPGMNMLLDCNFED